MKSGLFIRIEKYSHDQNLHFQYIIHDAFNMHDGPVKFAKNI